MVDGITSQGFRILANSFASPQATELLLETMGLKGVFFLCILGSPYSLGEQAPVGCILLYVVSSNFASVLTLLKMLINLFFCFMVGSVFRGLYLLVSSSSSFIFFMYSLLSMTTRATPLSAVKIVHSLSDFNYFIQIE